MSSPCLIVYCLVMIWIANAVSYTAAASSNYKVGKFRRLQESPYVGSLRKNASAVSGLASGKAPMTSMQLMSLNVGTPPTTSVFLLDTASDVTYIGCSSSSTYQPLPCGQPPCTANILQSVNAGCDVTSNQCSFSGTGPHDGAMVSGLFGKDIFAIGGLPLKSDGLIFACTSSGGGDTSRLLGLGKGPSSFPSQLGKPVYFCLPPDGSYTSHNGNFGFGSVNPTPPPLSFITPLPSSVQTGGYYLPLTAISIDDGAPLPIPSISQGILLDTASKISRLQLSAYSVLRDAYVAAAVAKGLSQSAPYPYSTLFDTCFNTPSTGQLEPTIPAINLHFDGGVTMTLRTQNVLVYPGQLGGASLCLGFSSTPGRGGQVSNILGSAQLAGSFVQIDTAAGTVGFASNVCN